MLQAPFGAYNLNIIGNSGQSSGSHLHSDSNLRVITWESSSGGDITARRVTVVDGAVSEIDLLSTPLAGSNLTAVVRDSEGSLRLIGLLMNGNGSNLRRIGSSKAGAASRIAAAGVSRSYVGLDPRDMVLTALRNSEGAGFHRERRNPARLVFKSLQAAS
jgi:hypothetical protein